MKGLPEPKVFRKIEDRLRRLPLTERLLLVIALVLLLVVAPALS